MNYKANDYDTLENIKRSLKLAISDYEHLSGDTREDMRGKTDRSGGVHEFFSSLIKVINEEQKYLKEGKLRGGNVYSEQDHLQAQYTIVHEEYAPDENKCLGHILAWDVRDIRVELWVTPHKKGQANYFEAKIYNDDEYVKSFILDETDILKDFEVAEDYIKDTARREYDAFLKEQDEAEQEGDERE